MGCIEQRAEGKGKDIYDSCLHDELLELSLNLAQQQSSQEGFGLWDEWEVIYDEVKTEYIFDNVSIYAFFDIERNVVDLHFKNTIDYKSNPEKYLSVIDALKMKLERDEEWDVTVFTE